MDIPTFAIKFIMENEQPPCTYNISLYFNIALLKLQQKSKMCTFIF